MKRRSNKNNESMAMSQKVYTLRAERAQVMRNFWCMNSTEERLKDEASMRARFQLGMRSKKKAS